MKKKLHKAAYLSLIFLLCNMHHPKKVGEQQEKERLEIIQLKELQLAYLRTIVTMKKQTLAIMKRIQAIDQVNPSE